MSRSEYGRRWSMLWLFGVFCFIVFACALGSFLPLILMSSSLLLRSAGLTFCYFLFFGFFLVLITRRSSMVDSGIRLTSRVVSYLAVGCLLLTATFFLVTALVPPRSVMLLVILGPILGITGGAAIRRILKKDLQSGSQ